ncbi:MAG: RHS repeat-associated core domain-containing protein, partial [Nitrospira sp.]|nr:RHS repeat-associated core domain-containing protein [Nitrospira sp.]
GMPRRHYRTNAQGDIVSETRSYYDGPAYQGLPFGQLTQGQLHRQEGWVEDKRYVNLTRMAYDAFGNMTGVLDPNGGSRTIQYDPLFHSFPEKETIEVGGGNPDLVIAASYNLGLGVVETNTDVNGNRTAYRYDRFGRLVSVVKPGDSELWPTTTYAYTLSDPLAKLIYHYDSEGTLTTTTNRVTPSAIQTKAREVSGHAGTFDQIQYVDGLGRELAHIQEGDEGFVVNQAVQFNVRGIVRTTGLPYKTSSAEYGAPPVGERVQIETHYDAMGREVVRTNPPDAEGMVTRMTTAYLPLKKTTVDENGIPKTLLFDGQERLREVHETNEGEIYRTRYAYHPLGHLEQVIDAQESVKEMIYDGLGRRTTLKDPDRGLMAYTYDDAGNVTQTVDNKDQTIVYTYDKVNRILTEDFHDGANHHPDIAYHYDKPSPDYPEATQVKGNLGWVEDLSGGAFFSYDARGNTTWSVKWITDEGVSKNYRLGAEYDALGRVVATLYPDGDRVEYRYNQGTLLKQIPGYVDRIEYAPSGQYTHYVYANGITTTYDYDPRNRLRQLTTQSTASPSSVLQTLSYKVDGVGNITHITDQRGVPENAPENATQTFQYDDLSRLTQAEGPGYGRITYQYDKIGNMIFKGSPPHPHPQHIDDPLINLGVMANGGVAGAVGRGLKRPGDPPGPHAVTGTESGLQFAYDDNGNMTQHNKDLYEWNAKDRLIQATTEKGTSEYVYDFRGQRVIKKVQSGGAKENVYYVSKEYEIREGNPVKFIFDGDRRVARIDQNSPSKASMEKLLFYHPDHLGSASVKTNSTGKEVARTEFYPYGRPRNWENSKLLFSYDYNGKELDNETELIYYGARFFQPNLGRFISVDPVIEIPEEQIGGSHLGQSYLYAVGNPLTFIDQDGKRAKHSKRKTHRGKVKDIRNLLKTVQIRNIKDLAETLKEKNRSREDYLPSLNSVLSQIAEDEQFANQELERSIEKLSFIGKVIFKIGGAPNDRIHNLRGHLLYLQESRKFTKQIYRRKEELIQSDYYSEIALLAWRGHRGMGNPFPTTEEEKLEFFTDIILKDVRGNFPSFMAKDFYLSSRSWSLQGRKEVGNLDWFLSEEQRPYNNVGQ